MGIPSVTTNLSGFGCFMQEHVADPAAYGETVQGLFQPILNVLAAAFTHASRTLDFIIIES